MTSPIPSPEQRPPSETREWWWIGCHDCGHWKVGPFTKADIADWCRAHGPAVFRKDETGMARESTCPNPCGGVR